MNKNEIRRRALRAAATVTLTMGFVGCGGSVVIETAEQDESSATGATTKASEPPPDDGGLTVVVDAGPADATADCTQTWDWSGCCADAGWDPNAGCTPWGPQMPPAMGVA